MEVVLPPEKGLCGGYSRNDVGEAGYLVGLLPVVGVAQGSDSGDGGWPKFVLRDVVGKGLSAL